jgi:hypothetical protein
VTRIHRGPPRGISAAQMRSYPARTVPAGPDVILDDTPVQGDLLDLLGPEWAMTGSREPAPLTERFMRYHEAHPEVYQQLVRLARHWVRQRGRQRVGIGALWEQLRWSHEIEISTLNNDYRACYARLLMAQEPDLADLFEVRRSVVDQYDGGT